MTGNSGLKETPIQPTNKQTGSTTHTPIKVDVEQYRSTGVTIVRGILNAAEISEVRQAGEELRLKAKSFLEDTFIGVTYFNLLRPCTPFAANINEVPQIPGELRRVTYPYAMNKTLNRYRTHPHLLHAIQQILGDNVVQLVNQYNFNPPGIGTGWGWHQDYRFRRKGLNDPRNNFVQVVMAVDHSSSKNGGIRVVPESDQLGTLTLDLENERAESFFDATKAVVPSMEPGDAVFFNPLIIHGSTPNKSATDRRVYINGFARRDACSHGNVVLKNGVIVENDSNFMEFEEELSKLPLAAKY